MTLRFITVLCVLQIIVMINCEDYRNVYARIKRAKYYSNPPMRFYKLPPPIQSIRSPFSYTPPPEYMDQDQNYAKKSPKVSYIKDKTGLNDEDFRNLIRYLSKQDIDRIVNFAADRDRHTEHVKPLEKRPSVYNTEPEIDFNKVFAYSDDEQPTQADSSQMNYSQIKSINGVENISQVKTYSDAEELKQNKLSYLNGFIQQELNADANREPTGDDHVYTNSETMKEEVLPRPENLRDSSEFEISYTNNVPTIVKSQSSSYKLENFASLPLMNYVNSKLETVNSYSVPHFTVTSSRNQIPPSLSSQMSSLITSPIQILEAPEKAAAAQQSDAHLKAIKIWTHKSTGTAYTLHDDGTLSLERPLRPKRKF